MNFLLDTNVVSEWTKPRPNPGVVDGANVDEDSVYLSVVTLAELPHGIERLSPGKCSRGRSMGPLGRAP
jgi:predicted nucleic acid-binding protein